MTALSKYVLRCLPLGTHDSLCRQEILHSLRRRLVPCELKLNLGLISSLAQASELKKKDSSTTVSYIRNPMNKTLQGPL